MNTLTSKQADVAAKIKDIIHQKLGVDETALVDTARFTSDLGLDSLDVLETFMELEKAFSVRISDEEAEKLTTVGSVIDHITARVK